MGSVLLAEEDGVSLQQQLPVSALGAAAELGLCEQPRVWNALVRAGVGRGRLGTLVPAAKTVPGQKAA